MCASAAAVIACPTVVGAMERGWCVLNFVHGAREHNVAPAWSGPACSRRHRGRAPYNAAGPEPCDWARSLAFKRERHEGHAVFAHPPRPDEERQGRLPWASLGCQPMQSVPHLRAVSGRHPAQVARRALHGVAEATPQGVPHTQNQQT